METNDLYVIRRFTLALLWLPLVLFGGMNCVRAELTFQYEILDDADGTFASRGWLDPESLFQRNIRAATAEWAGIIASDVTMSVRVDAGSFFVRAGGGYSNGRYLGKDTDGRDIWEPGPLTKVLTGSNPGETAFGYDILMGFDAEFVEDFYWFDPAPQTRQTPVNANRGDFISVVMHELGHAFGIAGYRRFEPGPNHGHLAPNLKSLFDSLTYFGGDGDPTDSEGDLNPMFFNGVTASQAFGSDLRLTHLPSDDFRATQNFYHFGSGCNDVPELTTSLMNSCVIPNGERLEITPIDIAVYADLGYPIVTATFGDFNSDGLLDAADINELFAAIGANSTDLQYDMNGDDAVNSDDATIWIADIKKTWPGDANMDGEFRTDDLIKVFASDLYETGDAANWEDGDWSGDFLFSSTDLVIAFRTGGFESGPVATRVVPEPNVAPFFAVGILMLGVVAAREPAISFACP